MSQFFYCACPRCDVMFRVTPDKLELSDGMVKCGVCFHIFDANPCLLVHSDSGYVPYQKESSAATEQPDEKPDDQPCQPSKVLREFSEPINIETHSELMKDDQDSELDEESHWAETTITILDSVTAIYSDYEQDWSSLPLYESIKRYINQGSTGTAVIVFTDLSMAKIYLVDGTPRAARHQGTEGSDVFRFCGDMKAMTVKFHESQDLVYSEKNLNSIIV